MLIPRSLSSTIINKLKTSNKAILLYGARQIGKTTLIQQILKKLPLKTLAINADQNQYIEILSSRNLQKLRSLVDGYDLLFIDEAQRIPEIGINLKILTDNLPNLKIIATGSSSLDLASKVTEPLTGRVWTYTLYPISFLELRKLYNSFELQNILENRLIYGSYPETFSLTNNKIKIEYLQNLSNSYLYKDILELTNLKNSSKIKNLLKLLAFQIGSQVSLAELASNLDISKDTVSRYINLLEQSFVIFRLSGFSRNLRKEVTKMDKIYFYDLGIRNIIIDNLKPLIDRNDQGQLWENFLIVERMKLLAYRQIPHSSYFWRVYTGAEIDYIEDRDSNLYGYEIKWGNKKTSAPKTWLNTYSNAHWKVINKDNWLDFIIR